MVGRIILDTLIGQPVTIKNKSPSRHRGSEPIDARWKEMVGQARMAQIFMARRGTLGPIPNERVNRACL